ncbi:MAG: 50S ribosomal protein L11 methyltransferase [Deltaproteobacteria bacterium]|jgi:ribosomal protein L11 methyltransferase|nr:50S ribosomal protein L11 methyltransferase [Deltaproteobacteria bacterium]
MEEWLQAVIRLPGRASEAASAALFESGCRSVWEDLPDGNGNAVMKAAFASEDAMRLMTELPQAAERISEAFGLGPGEVGIELEMKILEDWDAAWRKDQTPIRVSGRLVVCPSFWKGDPFDPPPEGEAPPDVVRVNAGAAFGSGRHPTTFMCLRLLSEIADELDAPGKQAAGGRPGSGPVVPGRLAMPSKVLDVGSGSGILAIASAMLFPDSDVLGLDTDPDTPETARKNASANKVGKRVQFRHGTADGRSLGFDVLMANITLNPLLSLAVEMTRAASPGARLVLSGILVDQAEECARAYQRLGWHWTRHLGQAEWSALEMSLPSGPDADGFEGGPDPERVILSEPSLETPPPSADWASRPPSADDDFGRP